jgi:hypothetical protein
MSPVALVLACTCLTGEPGRPDNLSEMRQAMESYLSRIRTIHLEYEETWEKAAIEDPLLRAYRESIKKANGGPGRGAPPPGDDSDPRHAVATETVSYDLLDAFPSLRLAIRFRKAFPDGTVEEHRVCKYMRGSRYTEVDDEHKATYYREGGTGGFPRTPLNVLGRRLYASLNRPLSAMLEVPSITVVEGTEMVRGLETVVLRVGPGIPPSHRTSGATGKEWMRLWLAPARSHLAVRAEFYIPRLRDNPPPANGVARAEDYYIHRAELDDFQPAHDQARNEDLSFPRLITYTDPAGTMRWRIERITINAPTSPRDFDPTIPSGYLMSRDGAAPSVKLNGGRTAERRVLADTSRAAKEILDREVSQGSQASTSVPIRVLVSLGFLVTVILLLVIRRRIYRAS